MSALLRCLSELEKLKLLLFDNDQYYLFEMIPKPFLIDLTAIKRKEGIHCKDDPKNIFVTHSQYWRKNDSVEQMVDNFMSSMEIIKEKKEHDLIDEKLLEILHSMNY